MNQLSVLKGLIWDPGSISSPKPFGRPFEGLNAGFLLGVIGMGVQGAWIIPPGDLISISGNDSMELFVNKVVGFGAGFIFLLLLWLVDLSILAAFRLKRMTPAIHGSFAVLAFIPLVCIPIHALFPPHLGHAGDIWLVWFLIAGFLAWQGVWLGILLSKGHVDASKLKNGILNMNKISIITVVVVVIEIVGGISFVASMPFMFGSNLNEFFWSWF